MKMAFWRKDKPGSNVGSISEENSGSALEAATALSSLNDINQKTSQIVLKRTTGYKWIIGAFLSFSMMMVFLFAVTYLFVKGVGIWGIRIPVAWGFAIVNFVWWVGIGHAGTFISAFLLLLRQDWRNAINRVAEAMTLFAVACAGLFPILHLGRPQLFYWLIPYPNTMNYGPQFRSPLVWDVFAVTTYAIVSILFWYLGLIPDLGTFRDRAEHPWAKRIYGIFAMGWRGAGAHWREHKTAAVLFAGLATPLVISVHSVVSLDFSAALVRGWHSTIFPPYFVAGALYSGFAMVLTILLPVRHFYQLKEFITRDHLEKISLLLLVTGNMVAYGYIIEIITGFYHGEIFEKQIMLARFFGPYATVYWCMLGLNLLVPQAFWFPFVRKNVFVLFALSLLINVGMWLERFVIVVTSLAQDFLPSSWGIYTPTRWDWMTLFGSMGLFASLLFLFIRGLPLLSMHELREQGARDAKLKFADSRSGDVP